MSISPEGGESRRSRLDYNMYATKKSIGQGLLDIALLVVTSTQMKYFASHPDHEFPTAMLVMLIASFILQGITGLLIPVLIYMNINIIPKQYEAAVTNHVVLGLNMLILALDAVKMGFASGYQLYKNETVLIP